MTCITSRAIDPQMCDYPIENEQNERYIYDTWLNKNISHYLQISKKNTKRKNRGNMRFHVHLYASDADVNILVYHAWEDQR